MTIDISTVTAKIVAITALLTALYGLYEILSRIFGSSLKNFYRYTILNQTDAPPEKRAELIIKASNFVSSKNVSVASNTVADYGDVIMNSEPYYARENSATWKINAGKGGKGHYCLKIQYASGDPRPVKVVLNGETVREMALNEVTPGFFMEHQRWSPVEVVYLNDENNILTLYRDNVFPHIHCLKLVPVQDKASYCC